MTMTSLITGVTLPPVAASWDGDQGCIPGRPAPKPFSTAVTPNCLLLPSVAGWDGNAREPLLKSSKRDVKRE
jgi:hypothetical protein